MTPNFIANICQRNLDNLDITNSTDMVANGLAAYNTACTLLEFYIQRHFLTFEITEQVYRFAKGLCEDKNKVVSLYQPI
jgi:hypothetical protein